MEKAFSSHFILFSESFSCAFHTGSKITKRIHREKELREPIRPAQASGPATTQQIGPKPNLQPYASAQRSRNRLSRRRLRKWYCYFLIVFEFNLVCKNFYSSVFNSEYPISVTDSYLNI